MEHYYLYKITNKINGMIYVGVHKTSNMDDGYMGSGKILKRAQNKYGIENFEKEILQFFNSSDDMYKAESQIVNEDFVNANHTYNLKLGGHGGWDHISDEQMKQSAKMLNENLSIEDRRKGGKNSKINDRLKILRQDPEFDRKYRLNCKTFIGKKHSKSAKEKMSKSQKKRLKTPEKNSQFGTMWICNIDLKENCKIKKDCDIPNGWVKGRNKWLHKEPDKKNPQFGKSWFNDGEKSYLLYPAQAKDLTKGRLTFIS